MREPAGPTDVFSDALLPQTRAVRIPASCDAEVLTALITRAAEAGFNTVVIDAFSRGFASFPSAVCAAAGLPRHHPWFRNHDCVAAACAAARRAGTAIYASVCCLRAGHSDQFPTTPYLTRRSDLLLRGRPRRWLGARAWSPRIRSDASKSVWLCPTGATARRLFAGIATELSASYPIDGVLLEDLTYPPTTLGDDFCGCPACTERLLPELGIDLNSGWPEPGTESYDRWCQWRADQLTHLVERVKARARKGRRSVRIAGLAGHRGEVPEKDPTLLATRDWLHNGLLDVYCSCGPTIPTGEPAPSPAVRNVSPGEPPADLRWKEIVVQTGQSDWQWPSGRTAGDGGVLVTWSGVPNSDDWQRARSILPPRVSPLESKPLENARLFLTRAADLGADGCAEAAQMATAIAERDRPTEPVGARLDRLLALSEVLERMRATPPLPDSVAADPRLAGRIHAHITTAAGLIRLAILTV